MDDVVSWLETEVANEVANAAREGSSKTAAGVEKTVTITVVVVG